MFNYNIINYGIMKFLDSNNAHKLLLLSHDFNTLNVWHMDCSKKIKLQELTDEILLQERYKNLETLTCFENNITDKSISELLNLKKLKCRFCYNITSESISLLKNLVYLNIIHCKNIDDDTLLKLKKLLILSCIQKKLNKNSISRLEKLIKLKCSEDNDVTK